MLLTPTIIFFYYSKSSTAFCIPHLLDYVSAANAGGIWITIGKAIDWHLQERLLVRMLTWAMLVLQHANDSHEKPATVWFLMERNRSCNFHSFLLLHVCKFQRWRLLLTDEQLRAALGKRNRSFTRNQPKTCKWKDKLKQLPLQNQQDIRKCVLHGESGKPSERLKSFLVEFKRWPPSHLQHHSWFHTPWFHTPCSVHPWFSALFVFRA